MTAVAEPLLAHRLVRTTDATVDGTTSEAILDDVVVERDSAAVRETVRWLAARARYRARLEEFYDLAERRATVTVAVRGA